jgi:pimeloyl-ACP methyl ester carboxylesterase
VTTPTLIAYGSKSPSNLKYGSHAIAEVLPNAELREVEGQTHNISVDALVKLLTDFLSEETEPVPAIA